MTKYDKVSGDILKDGKYKYSGRIMTDEILAEVFVYLYNDRQFYLKDALQEVRNFHVSHGGFKISGPAVVTIFKHKCCSFFDSHMIKVDKNIYYLSYRK